MESETKDTEIVVDGDLGDSFVLRQEVVIPLSHITIHIHSIVTPRSIFEYDVKHTITKTSLILTIVFYSSN